MRKGFVADRDVLVKPNPRTFVLDGVVSFCFEALPRTIRIRLCAHTPPFQRAVESERGQRTGQQHNEKEEAPTATSEILFFSKDHVALVPGIQDDNSIENRGDDARAIEATDVHGLGVHATMVFSDFVVRGEYEHEDGAGNQDHRQNDTGPLDQTLIGHAVDAVREIQLRCLTLRQQMFGITCIPSGHVCAGSEPEQTEMIRVWVRVGV
mmetsp:Transcript_53755/g.174792  ORF Transcript_53755/g.174792 Transcript_53755/m.174792 type:complete len:209 (+) Transcript_53755:2034-2660(+)